MALADAYKDPQIKALAEAMETEQRLRDEVIAWRNRFPQYVFDPRACVLVARQPNDSSGGPTK